MRKFKGSLLTSVLIVFSALVPNAFAQDVGLPRQDDTPFSQSARGFISAQIGLSAIPVFSLDAAHMGQETEYSRIWDDKVNIPGLSAGMDVVPAFGNNALVVGASYILNGAEFRSEVRHEGELIRGTSTMGMSCVDIHVGYARFFLDGPWHLYFDATGNVFLEKFRSTASYDGQDSLTTEDSFMNYGGSLGFGFFHNVSTGGIGGALKVDYMILPSVFTLEDPFGSADFELSHPATIKLMAIFLLGRI